MSYRSRNKPQTTLEKIRERRQIRKMRSEQYQSALKLDSTPPAAKLATPKPTKAASAKEHKAAKPKAKTAPKTVKAPKVKAAPSRQEQPRTIEQEAATAITPEREVEPQDMASDAVQDLYNERLRIIERIEALEDELQTQLGHLDAVDTVLSALIPNPTLMIENKTVELDENEFNQINDISYKVIEH